MVTGVPRLLAYGLLAVVLVMLLTAQESSCGGETSGGGQAEEQDGGGEDDSGDEDTGRMSEGEFQSFSDFDLDFAGELEEWSAGYATCARIGQTGDLVGFRDCIEEEWEGVEDAGLLAYGNADDTLDDVAKECAQALRNYRNRVDQVYSRNLAAYEAAKSLEASSIGQAFRGLTRIAKRYANASVSTRDACNPG